MKQFADAHRTERSYEVGDLVYVKLHPYRQHSLKQHTCQKLLPRYFGPYPIEEKIGAVAYKLRLLDHAKIHPIFHVSQLKKKIGDHHIIHALTAGVTTQGQLLQEPIEIIDKRVVKRGRMKSTQILVLWSNSFPEDDTWEFLQDFEQRFPNFSS